MQNNVTAINKTEWLLVALALALLAALALRPSVRGNDGVGHYVYLAALLRHGSLDFSDEYRRFDALRQYPYKFSELWRSPATGRPSNRYGIGAAAFWSPFVLAVHGTLKLARPAEATGLTPPYEWAVGLATAFWGSLALALLYGRLRRRLAPLAAAAVISGLIFATPLGFYLYAHGSMSHGVSFFIMAALLLAFERAWRAPSPVPFAWCGFWSAWLLMCRFQDATWVLVLALALLYRLLRPPTHNSQPVSQSAIFNLQSAISFLSFPAAFFSVFWLQMAVWKYLYGSWFAGPMPYLDRTAGSFTRWPVHLIEALFSSNHGVLAWHPLIAIGLAGLILLSLKKENEDRFLGLIGLLGFAAQLWLVASWSMWWAGASFGNRFFISSLPLIALGLGRLAESLRTRPQRFAALLLLFFLMLWNLGLLYQYATEMIPREAPVPWRQIIHQNFIYVPQALFSRLQ